MKQRKEIKLYGRLHSDICNVSRFLFPGVRLHFKFNKARSSFFIMNTDNDSKVEFRFVDAKLLVHRIKPSPSLHLSHNTVLSKGGLARYNLTRVEHKTFTFSKCSISVSIDNTVLVPITKRFLFTVVKNTDFLGSLDTNPNLFCHYDITNFMMHVNRRPIPTEGLSLGTGHEKTSVMGNWTLFVRMGIHHSNLGLRVTNDMYIAGYFILLFDLTRNLSASESHTSHPDNGNIRNEA
jgi:hypothetical protein